MYQIKKRIYKDFDNTQKNAVCNNLRALVKQNLKLSPSEILEKFTENEKYYLELDASRFPFLADCIEESEFLSDTEAYISECIKYYRCKEAQKPLIEAQKEYEKKKRKYLQEVKMSKEKPTQKQVYYYTKLCKRYNIELKDINELSKLDMRNEIDRILNENSTAYENID